MDVRPPDPQADEWTADWRGTAPAMDDSRHAEPPAREAEEHEPAVRMSLDGGVATVTVDGELTEAARRPMVRAVTDLLLGTPALRELRLDLRAVSFMNSAGMAVLVQLQKLVAPRGVELVLVAPPELVVRPLQLSGLWTRFRIDDAR